MPLQQFDENFAVYGALQFTDADTAGTWVNVSVSNVYVRRWDTIQVCNEDTVDHDIGYDQINGDGTSVLGYATAAAGVGNGAVPPLDLLASLLPNANHYLVVNPGDVPAFTFRTAISAGKKVTIFLLGGAV